MPEWKMIAEFPDYEVSDDGKIRFIGGVRAFGSTATRIVPSCEKKPQPHSGGYLQVMLSADRKQFNRYIHRLVALAFIEPVEGKRYVNHKNGDKTDNRVENLEWVTFQENMAHKVNVLGSGRGETHSQARITEADVRRIRSQNGELDRIIADELGISRSYVGDIRRGKAWQHLNQL